jgi:hypothetical protein
MLARALLATLALLLAGAPAWAQQPNFKPLEQGDYTEVEQRLLIARGLEVGAEYALRMGSTHHPDLPPERSGMDTEHDLRLKLDTVFHTDVRVHLTLELSQHDFSAARLRESDADAQGRLNDSLPTAISAREAYLRYNFNPRSGLIFGKQELSLGDRRGKTFNALVPGVTFDCMAGTWCMPFGYANIGARNADAVVHWALQYNAWDEQVAGRRDALQVEIFRLRYHEEDVPLGRNLGPARFNPDDPGGAILPTEPDPSQLLQVDTNTVYYDAKAQDYYGLRVTWLGGPLFVNFDATAFRGERRYHLFDETAPLEQTGQSASPRGVKGSAVEAELGWRWAAGRAGLRLMSATGDKYLAYSNGQDYNRGLIGYYEITPGTYSGTRLWFNGTNSSVESGAGLGHSINNTRLAGLFLDVEDRETRKIGYSGGLYQLTLNNPIPDGDGVLQGTIGVELDNMITWYVHKALKFQLELNGILAGGALRLDDQGVPDPKQDNIYQVVGRVVYGF